VIYSAINLPHKSIHVANHGNANPPVLRIVRETEPMCFVNFLGHLPHARDVGYSGREIVFKSSGMTKSNAGGACEDTILNCIPQANCRFRRLFPNTPPSACAANIGARVNRAKRTAITPRQRNSLGIDLEELKPCSATRS
jgi:diaminopimelate decarboxylase